MVRPVLAFILLLFGTTFCQESPCIIDFECEECLPDYLPMITSHQATGPVLVIPSGEKVTFLCHKTKFYTFPNKNMIQAYCESNRYRVLDDTSIRHLADLGCQANFYEDILHNVDGCPSPRQGRSYLYHDSDTLAVRHIAEMCYDQDSAKPVFTRITTANNYNIAQPQHTDRESPLSLLGNFNKMFDTTTKIEADKLYSDEKRMNKRVHELLKHNKFNFAGQTLRPSKLLSGILFKDQNMMVTNFASNRIPVWESVDRGNFNNLNHDLKRMATSMTAADSSVEIFAGTHGVLTMRSENSQVEIYLKPGNRFPVPKFIWTILYDKKHHKALAVTVLNDPFVSISEIRDTVFCTSICNQISWLRDLRQNSNFETPLYGLVFCCDVHSFATKVPEVPSSIIRNVHHGEDGILNHMPFGGT